MSQAYTKYNGKTALKTKLDVKYPKNFAQAKVNGSTSASIGWAPSGKGKCDYNVVAIYNDDDFAGAKYITYAFAFHDGQPVALVDQATNGGPDFIRPKTPASATPSTGLPTGRVPPMVVRQLAPTQ